MGTVQVKKQLISAVRPYQKKEVQLYDSPWLRLDRNESHFGISPKAIAAVKAELQNISSYPENTGLRLRKSLASYHSVAPDQILIGNGSYELIWLIASVYLDADGESITAAPTFNAYKKYGNMFGNKVLEVPVREKEIDLNGILTLVTTHTKVIWLCNPNNPTGHYISTACLENFLRKIPADVLVVIDEAYIELIDTYTARESINLIESFDNVILLRTFSKFYGLASLRIGYALSSLQTISTLLQFRVPPNHSRIAEEAARASIEDTEFQSEIREKIREERVFIGREFDRLGIIYLPTQTNFLLFQSPKVAAEIIRTKLVAVQILVKSGEIFGLDGWVRLTIGDRKANQRLIYELEKIISKNS